MSRPLCGLVYRAMGGVWRRKLLAGTVFSVTFIGTFLFMMGIRHAVDEAKDSMRRRRLNECSILDDYMQKGPLDPDLDINPSNDFLVNELGPSLKEGGWYRPPNCRAKNKVAVVVPYRDRHFFLKKFLYHMHPFLQRQHIEYVIVVVEQAPGARFNRALLFNVGFVELMARRWDLNCFVFHDVDLIPLDDRNLYTCMDEPLHLSMLVDTLGDSLMYPTLFGGAVALTPSMIRKVNGFSNLFFGWGGEDDDMSYRLRNKGMIIQRYSRDVARYTMMRHPKEDYAHSWADDVSRKMKAGEDRFDVEGLNTLKYKLLDYELLPLFTRITVEIDEGKILREFGYGHTLFDQARENLKIAIEKMRQRRRERNAKT